MIGTVEITLGSIVSSPGATVRQALKHPTKQVNTGFITISAEQIRQMNAKVKFILHGSQLDRKDFLGRSDPFLRISRKTASGGWDAVHKTEVIRQNLNPEWKEFTIPVQTLCNGDPNRPLLFQ